MIRRVGYIIALCIASTASAQVPPQPAPFGVKPSASHIELGRKLFFDPRLSQNGSVSCSTCHDPRKGWADGRALAVGIDGRVGNRHTPTIINSGYTPLVFWDGRTVATTTQSLLPLANPNEMANQVNPQNDADVVERLKLIPGYVRLFTESFNIDTASRSAITGANLAYALAAFESSVTSFDAPIDRFEKGDKKALSPDAQVGYRIFEKANCKACHKPPLWTDNLFHNNGFEHAGLIQPRGQFDVGRFNEVPRNLRTNAMIRAFKTPTLRDHEKTAPYGHHGAMESTERVVLHYSTGGMKFDGTRDRFMDPRIKPLDLTDTQRKYLATLLKEGFSGSRYPMIEAPTLP